jgi:hypothetical protein
MEKLHILHRSGYIGNEPPVRNCPSCTKDCDKRKGETNMTSNKGEKALGLPSLTEVIEPYGKGGMKAHAEKEDHVRLLIAGEYGQHKAEEMFRTYTTENLVKIAHEIAKRLTKGIERLELPVMNISRRKSGDKDDGVLGLPKMTFDNGRG